MKNKGVRDQFLMKNTHEQIIESGIFEQAQSEIKRRSNIEIINGKEREKEHTIAQKNWA